MVHYYLHRWEAIELFCKAISKYEAERKPDNPKDKWKQEFTLEDFKANSAIIDAFRKYTNKVFYNDFTNKAFAGANSKLLYNLVLWIKASRPIILSETELTELLRYIGERNTLDRYNNIMPQELSSTQRAFENTQWWLYNYDDYEDESGKVVEGITRAVVYLNPYARVEIANYKPVDRKVEVYKGKYEIYESEYLRLELTIKATFGKDLTILAHIGENEPHEIDLILGQFHNIDHDHIYSGTIILQRTQSVTREKPRFFNKANPEDVKLIDDRFWTYFSNKFQNRIRVKHGIYTMDKFSVWLKKQNNKRKSTCVCCGAPISDSPS